MLAFICDLLVAGEIKQFSLETRFGMTLYFLMKSDLSKKMHRLGALTCAGAFGRRYRNQDWFEVTCYSGYVTAYSLAMQRVSFKPGLLTDKQVLIHQPYVIGFISTAD